MERCVHVINSSLPAKQKRIISPHRMRDVTEYVLCGVCVLHVCRARNVRVLHVLCCVICCTCYVLCLLCM